MTLMEYSIKAAQARKWRKIVRANLNIFKPTGICEEYTVLQLCSYLKEHTLDCKNARPSDLFPHVAEWVDENKKK